MNLKVLGSGPILQEKYYRNCSGYLIDNRILFDCGPGIFRALNENGLAPAKLAYLIITHFHIDHVSDLAPILMARYLTLNKTEGPIRIFGPEGIGDWYKSVKKYCGEWSHKLPVELIVAKDQGIADYTLYSGKTGHTENSLCYSLVDKSGTRFFYSGDSGINNILGQLSRHSDLAVLEASNTNQTQMEGHLTPYQAGEIAGKANVRRLVLTHMYPEVSAQEARRQAAVCFKGEIFIARDGMSLDFNAD
jgi:ribonuclease BN (tRNA processing enzyme)